MKRITTLLLFTAALLLSVALPILPTVVAVDNYYGLAVENPVPVLPLAKTQEDTALRIIFFGYRSCSTVCPIQFGSMMQLQQRMRHQPIEFVFVTLDPERDTKILLEETTASLGAQFQTVRPETTLAAQNLALAYGDNAARFQHRQGYDFNHSANLYVVTDQWQRRLIYTGEKLDINRMESDLNQLLSSL